MTELESDITNSQLEQIFFFFFLEFTFCLAKSLVGRKYSDLKEFPMVSDETYVHFHFYAGQQEQCVIYDIVQL